MSGATTGEVTAPAVAPLVEAKRFILRDDNGKRRAELTSVDVEDGSPYLVLRDKEERVRLVLRSNRDGGASIGLRDAAGQARLTMGLGSDGYPGLDLWSATGKRRAALYDFAKLGSALVFYHDDGASHVVLSLAPDGTSRMVLNEPLIMLMDKDGKVLWKEP